MPIPRETESTDEILDDSRFHRASIKADPETADLATRVETAEAALKAKRDASAAAEDVRLEAYAVLIRRDFDLDELCRISELDVYKVSGEDRQHATYRACFGAESLSSLVAMRGEEQARAVGKLVVALRERAPELATTYADALTTKATAGTAAETAWKQAETDAGAAYTAERIARLELIRQLQKNEGALAERFPGKAGKVRSFFRPSRRGKAKKAAAPAPAT